MERMNGMHLLHIKYDSFVMERTIGLIKMELHIYIMLASVPGVPNILLCISILKIHDTMHQTKRITAHK